MPKQPAIMAIINLTSDSFSGDGCDHLTLEQQLQKVEQAFNAGAEILDIGGQSTRPTAQKLTPYEEWVRVTDLLTEMPKNKPISLDTYIPDIAQRGLELGVSIINNVGGEDDAEIARITAASNAKLVVMHRRDLGLDLSDDKAPAYRGAENDSAFFENFLSESRALLSQAIAAGMKKENLIFDPGIGFGKTPAQNMLLIRECKKIRQETKLPLLLGASRKSFIAKITDTDASADNRLGGSLAALALSYPHADIIRAHDVAETYQFLSIMRAGA